MPEKIEPGDDHGPSRGYSGMNAHLDKFLRGNPKYAASESPQARRRYLCYRPGEHQHRKRKM